MSAPSPLDPYFREAASWDADKTALIHRSARTAWRVAAAGWICAVASCAALAALLPLKQVEPFVIRVDNSTGIVDVVPTYVGQMPTSELVTRYFLTHYVTVCERLNFATAESDYQECGAFHGAQRNQAWYALWNPANPNSPLNLHKDGSAVRVQVESVSFFKRASGLSDLAQVRYVKVARQGPGANERVTHWIATVQFAYGAPSGDLGARHWNPLGFKVTEFTPEPEAPAEQGFAARSAASATSASK